MIDFIYVSSERWVTIQEKHLPWALLDQPRILFIEKPLSAPYQAKSELSISSGLHIENNIRIIRLLQPAPPGQPIYHGDKVVQSIYDRLLSDYLEREGVTAPILWLCNLQGIGFTEVIEPCFMVVDITNDQITSDHLVEPVGSVLRLLKMPSMLAKQHYHGFIVGDKIFVKVDTLGYDQPSHIIGRLVRIVHASGIVRFWIQTEDKSALHCQKIESHS